MNYYTAFYQDYGLRCWADSSTGQVAVIEYYPVEPAQALAVDAAAKNGNTAENVKDSKPADRYAIYFRDLGLDMADFGSLGYEVQQ